MAIQQLSSGGAVTPVTGLAPTVTSLTGTDGFTFNLQAYDKAIQGLVDPNTTGQTVGIVPFTGNPNSGTSGTAPQTGPAQGTGAGNLSVAGQDPFLFAGMAQELGTYDAQTGSNTPLSTATSDPETTNSPGYAAFGQNWLNLLNTISTDNLQWGGRNDFSPDLKGGGSVTPWDQTNIVSPWTSGNQQQAYYNAVDFISKNTGLDPSSQEAQKLGGAYLDYTLGNNNLYNINSSDYAARGNQGKGILGDILGPVEDIGEVVGALTGNPEITAGIAALQAATDLAQGDTTGALLSGLSAVSGGAASIADPTTGIADTLGIVDTAAGELSPASSSLLSDIGAVGQGAGIASGVGSVAQGLATGNPFEAITGAVGAGTSGVGLFDSTTGTTGTNASLSNDITSGIANTLGLDPGDLTTDLKDINTLGTIAGAGVPLLENALNAPSSNLNLPPVSSAPPTSSTSSATPLTPDIMGTALTPQGIENPAQAGYKAPKQDMGLEQLLQELNQG